LRAMKSQIRTSNVALNSVQFAVLYVYRNLLIYYLN